MKTVTILILLAGCTVPNPDATDSQTDSIQTDDAGSCPMDIGNYNVSLQEQKGSCDPVHWNLPTFADPFTWPCPFGGGTCTQTQSGCSGTFDAIAGNVGGLSYHCTYSKTDSHTLKGICTQSPTACPYDLTVALVP